MTDFNQNVDQAKDLLNLEQKDMAKLPSMLNVLTILTYVGCALGAIGAIWSYFSAAASYKMIETLDANSRTGNTTLDNMMTSTTLLAKKQYDNRLTILLVSLIGIGLCFWGALQMRNLKKQGYLFYVIGELMPVVTTAILIGFGSLFAGIAMIFSVLLAALFIILYTTQRKYLVN